jgi:cubilin
MSSVCGGLLNNGSYGTINSPGYPGNYPHDRDCVWVVTVPPGNNIMFQFATLQIESHPNCSFDYLEVWGWGKKREKERERAL